METVRMSNKKDLCPDKFVSLERGVKVNRWFVMQMNVGKFHQIECEGTEKNLSFGIGA